MGIHLNLAVQPKFIRPELLLHPSIPKILSGVNPRTIKGKEWWDVVRRKVYAENNHHCEACGTHQLDALFRQTLDAHETYTYDYEKYEAYPGEVVALCRACHWFIHWRRVRSWGVRRDVVIRGLKILADAGLPVPYWQHRLAAKRHWDWDWGEETYPNLEVQARLLMEESILLSYKWVLVLEGVKYNIGGVKCK